MKISSGNYDEVKDTIIKSLERYIKYVKEYRYASFEMWEEYEKYNNIFKECKGDKISFKVKTGFDLDDAFEDKKYLDLLPIAESVIDNIDKVHMQVIEVFIEPYSDVYPNKVLEWLYDFRYFCFNDNDFLSLELQNEALKKYPHFDASKKRPKTFGSVKNN